MFATPAKILVAALAITGVGRVPEPFHLISGAVPNGAGPDGNTIIFDAPQGLIVVDTGRHPAHSAQIIAYAKSRHQPVAAVINTHWHLDHTTGNWDLRRAYPRVQIYASAALEGALATYLKASRARSDAVVADAKISAALRAELIRGQTVIDHPGLIRPNHIVSRTGPLRIAGRTLHVHLARFAATEGDVWIYDRRSRTAVVGDLVVDLVPFMDTACPEGWSKALAEIAATPFITLVPGHGAPMSRQQFTRWRSAFQSFVDCGHSTDDGEECVARWMRGAAPFIDAAHRQYVRNAAGYYLKTRLRSDPEERQRYCKPLKS